jgi:hypothetical protein
MEAATVENPHHASRTAPNVTMPERIDKNCQTLYVFVAGSALMTTRKRPWPLATLLK